MSERVNAHALDVLHDALAQALAAGARRAADAQALAAAAQHASGDGAARPPPPPPPLAPPLSPYATLAADPQPQPLAQGWLLVRRSGAAAPGRRNHSSWGQQYVVLLGSALFFFPRGSARPTVVAPLARNDAAPELAPRASPALTVVTHPPSVDQVVEGDSRISPIIEQPDERER